MGNKKPHPTKSFEQYVADATSQKLGAEIDDKVNFAVTQALAFTGSQVSKLLTRILSVEQILMERFPEITSEMIEARAHEIESLAAGYSEDRPAIENDSRVRISVSVQQTPESPKSEPQILVIPRFGSGAILGEATEAALIGLPVGDEKTLIMGENGPIAHFAPISVKAKPAQANAVPDTGLVTE